MSMPNKYYFGKYPESTLNSFTGKIMQIKGGIGGLITNTERSIIFVYI